LSRVPRPADITRAPRSEAGADRLASGPAQWIGHAAGLCAITVLAATVFLFHLGSYGLWEPDEARYAEIAREMLASRDFILPHLNYVPYVEKPPLLYWLTAASFAIGGETDFTARLAPAVAAIAGVIATYLFVARVFDNRRALLAGAILATAPLYAVMGQVLTTDMLLTTLVTIALFAFYLAWREGSDRGRRWWWLFCIAMALGTLAKGPVAIVLPASAAIAFVLWKRRSRNLSPGPSLKDGEGSQTPGAIVAGSPFPSLGKGVRGLGSGALLTLAIAAPWFLIVTWREPDFASFYFVGEHLRRFFEPDFSHGEPFYFYVPVIILGFLPWSILAPIAGSTATANRDARDFCLIAALVIFGFFSLASGKLIPYVLPAFPPLAVVIADATIAAAGARARRFAPAAMVVLGLLGTAALVVAIAAPVIRTPYALAVRPALLADAMIMIASSAMVGAMRARGRTQAAPAIVVLMMAIALLAGSYARLEAEPLRSYARLSRAIADKAPDATLICYRRYVQGLPYYTRRRVILVGAPTELRFGMEHSADAASWFFTSDDDLIRLWSAPRSKSTVLVIDEPDLERLQPRLGKFVLIAAEGQKRAILHLGDQVGSN
jgi:4-amino-4-deoxy-L-arabinose transferase-like glycosyltransferase